MQKVLKYTLPTLCALFLASCGGGGGSSPPPPPPPPPPPAAPSALSYPAAPAFAVGAAITQLVPTVTGTVASYIVAPALPAGLALNTGSGAITGTPTAVTATANYLVTASNTSGSTSTTLSLTVNDIVPNVAYPGATHLFTTGVPVALTPTNAGGAATQWSVDQPLPAGLTLNHASGVISGNPTEMSAASAYVITATNSGGTDTFNLSLAVQNGVLLDLGHAAEIQALRFDGSRIASLDVEGHMALWNAQTGAEIASTDTACNDTCGDLMALAGATAVFRQPTGLDVRSSVDGTRIATINLPASAETWWKLAADGSYISAGTLTGVTVWAPNGAVLFSHNGNYSTAKPFAAPAELRIAAGPAGNVIEKLSVPGGALTSITINQGTFHSWFLDGERFLANVGTTVWVYSHDVEPQDLVALPTIGELTGQGNWFWTNAANVLRVFRVGTSSTPTASYTLTTLSKVVASGGVLALLPYGERAVSIVDLAGATPVRTDHVSPVASTSAFAARNASDWVIGNSAGVTLGELNGPGAPTQYSLGQAYSVAASNSRIAVATAAGDIIYFDAATRIRQGEIEFRSSQLEMSADGTRLAALANTRDSQYQPDRTIRVYELPTETVLGEWPYAFSTAQVFGVTLSLSGTVIGQTYRPTGVSNTTRQVTNVDGTPIWSDSTPQSLAGIRYFSPHLSPDGSLIAASNGSDSNGSPGQTTTTRIYTGGTLTTAITGDALGWIDSNRLLVNRYRPGRFADEYDRCEIVTAAGQISACPPLPLLARIQPLTPNSIYSPQWNTIYDLTTGASLWTSAAPTRREGAVAGNSVVFTSGATVRIEPR